MYATSETFDTPIVSAPILEREHGAFGSREMIEKWLATTTSRKTAELTLINGGYDVGAYCVRRSKNQAVITALAKNGKAVNYRIEQDDAGMYSLEGGKLKFTDVPQLVAHFSKKPVSTSVGVLTACIPLPETDSFGFNGMDA